MARQAALILAAFLAALCLGMPAHAYDPSTSQTPWQRLSPDERRVLGPLAPDWDRLPGFQQQRLISSARRYPSLQPIQKERFDERLRDWASMTPEQRREARETFQGLRKLPPEKQHELRERWLRERGFEGPRARGPEEGRRGGRPEGPSSR
ncbi:MAG: DUF3106 domain-containing protein [Usitatibacter sp.]